MRRTLATVTISASFKQSIIHDEENRKGNKEEMKKIHRQRCNIVSATIYSWPLVLELDKNDGVALRKNSSMVFVVRTYQNMFK